MMRELKDLYMLFPIQPNTMNGTTRERALHFAAKSGNLVICGLLLQYGADEHAETKTHESAQP